MIGGLLFGAALVAWERYQERRYRQEIEQARREGYREGMLEIADRLKRSGQHEGAKRLRELADE